MSNFIIETEVYVPGAGKRPGAYKKLYKAKSGWVESKDKAKRYSSEDSAERAGYRLTLPERTCFYLISKVKK